MRYLYVACIRVLPTVDGRLERHIPGTGAELCTAVNRGSRKMYFMGICNS